MLKKTFKAYIKKYKNNKINPALLNLNILSIQTLEIKLEANIHKYWLTSLNSFMSF